MKEESLLKKSYKSTIWSFVENISHELVSFGLSIILARLLMPADFGIIGLTTIFVTISNVLVDSGFGNALIRKVDRNQNDCSTAFLFNIGIGCLSYFAIFIISPFAADFYKVPVLTNILRIVGFNVLLNSLCVVQIAILTANFNIKIQTKINVICQIVWGVIAVIMAYNNLGIWSLVVQVLGANFMKVILLWYFAKWIPNLAFSRLSFDYLWGYGSKAVATSLLGAFFNEFSSILIGKFYTRSDLGFYTKANQLSKVPLNTTTGVIKKVTIPMFAQVQGDINELRKYYSNYTALLSFGIFPIMFIIAVLSRPIVVLMWGEKWEPCIDYLKILCIGVGWAPISTLNTSLLQVLGKTGFMLKLELQKKIVLFFMIVSTIYWGIKSLVIGYACYHFVAALMNMKGSRHFLNFTYKNQLMDIIPYVLLSFVSYFIIDTFLIFDNHLKSILIGGIIGLFIYIGLAYMFKVRAICIVLKLVKNRSRK